MLNLYQAGVFDRDEFVNTMQTLSDAARRVHASQPSSLMNSCRSFLEDEGSMHYAYTEGASLAFKMDLDLRRLTNGLKSLPDFMRRYMESYRYREKSVEAFQAEWKAYAPEALYPMAALAERPNPTVFDTSLRDLGVLDGGERAGAGRRWEAPSDSAFMLYFD
jgi:predicted metalloprotease with PDZ domain